MAIRERAAAAAGLLHTIYRYVYNGQRQRVAALTISARHIFVDDNRIDINRVRLLRRGEPGTAYVWLAMWLVACTVLVSQSSCSLPPHAPGPMQEAICLCCLSILCSSFGRWRLLPLPSLTPSPYPSPILLFPSLRLHLQTAQINIFSEPVPSAAARTNTRAARAAQPLPLNHPHLVLLIIDNSCSCSTLVQAIVSRSPMAALKWGIV